MAEMARLPIRGSSVASPAKGRAELRDVLSTLCPSHAFDGATVDRLYDQLGDVISGWFSEQGRPEADPVAKALRAVARNLTDASRILGGHETGFHTNVEIEAVSVLSEHLASVATAGRRFYFGVDKTSA